MSTHNIGCYEEISNKYHQIRTLVVNLKHQSIEKHYLKTVSLLNAVTVKNKTESRDAGLLDLYF